MSDPRRFVPSGDGSQNTQGSSQYRRGNARRPVVPRRSWSGREEAVLMVAMKDLVAHGWKSDNGFRGGYLNKVEEWMQKEFPITDLKANPHIQSKLTAVKKSYNSLAKILDRSGVEFNVHGDFKIDCDDDQWDQIVKQDSNARRMRTRSWPYWEDWKVIFGKDRANGGHAEWVVDAAANSSPDAPVTEIGESSDYHPSFEDFLGYDEQMQATFANPMVDDSSTQSGANATANAQVPPKNKRKRKVRENDSGIVEILRTLHSETSARLETLALRIGYEMDLGKARAEIFGHLGNIPELTENERYDLCDIIGKKNSHLEIFRGLPDASKAGYAKRVLEKEGRT
ncbi:hypothetical protein SASPL_112158 [Salvia splendens]|uniref:Myb/SANT-like domain-containing protein n=1 Tax=Salvia splendens TaxID=180675 RepID=A0A8X8Y892_SALSN|nr:hypothetical protein SASPL_112158 [Salvia splendens]